MHANMHSYTVMVAKTPAVPYEGQVNGGWLVHGICVVGSC